MARILIAEDDGRTAEKVQSLLAAASHATVVTRSGQEGIERLEDERYDLVITDLMMEEGTGFDVLEWIRVNARDLPVVICSAYARPESLRPHLAGLRYRVVKKPFDAEDLTGVVGALLLEAGEPPPPGLEVG